MRIPNSMPCAIALVATLAMPHTMAGQEAKATEVLGGARKAIGGKKLDGLTSFSVQARTQRNIGNFQMTSDLELLLGLPDKYVRSESSNSAMVNMSSTAGFNGDRPIKGPAQAGMPAGGGMIIRMGGPGMVPAGGGDKPTPEQQAALDKQIVRSARQEISRFMLGWFATAHPSVSAQYTYAGEAESPDGKAFIVDVKSADGFAARLFIDEATHLPLMVTYRASQLQRIAVDGPPRTGADGRGQVEQVQAQPPAMVDYTLYFDDWREEDGIKFPHALRRASAGATMEEWTVTKVKVNPKIDPKKFDSEQ
jgi:hypothetical protein